VPTTSSTEIVVCIRLPHRPIGPTRVECARLDFAYTKIADTLPVGPVDDASPVVCQHDGAFLCVLSHIRHTPNLAQSTPSLSTLFRSSLRNKRLVVRKRDWYSRVFRGTSWNVVEHVMLTPSRPRHSV
jgi:hypothetical protein